MGSRECLTLLPHSFSEQHVPLVAACPLPCRLLGVLSTGLCLWKQPTRGRPQRLEMKETQGVLQYDGGTDQASLLLLSNTSSTSKVFGESAGLSFYGQANTGLSSLAVS